MKYFKWNCVVDDRTCPECLSLNGKSCATQTIPPLHKKDENHPDPCRCFLTEIKVTEIEVLKQ